MADKKKKHVDPLYQLFEHYLLNRSYEDASKFTKEIAVEYVAYLDSTHAHVPLHVRKSVLEDLEGEAHEMLVKKMYGCVKSADYQNVGSVLKGDPSTGLAPHEFIPASSNEETAKKED